MKSLLLLGLTLLSSSAYSQSQEVRFRAAKQKEVVEGDLPGAIRIYRDIANSKESSHDQAAQALLRLGRCYEKLGSTESRKAYEELLRQYSDEVELVSEARRRLAALTPSTAAKGELTATLLSHLEERVRSGFDIAGYVENVATDGHTVYRLGLLDPWDQDFHVSLKAVDLETGRTRELYRGKFFPCGLSLSPDGKQLAFAAASASPKDVTASIYTIGVDGSNARRVFTEVSERMRTQFMGPWSPNQQEVVISDRGAGRPSTIAIVALKEGSIRRWTELSASRDGTFSERLSLSPDGQWLAYDLPSGGDGGERSIRIVRRGSSNPSVLKVGEGSNKVLGWFPDGRDLLFASDRRGTADAYRIPVVNGKPNGEAVLIRTNIGSARSLGFRPDGSFYFINDGFTRAVKVASFDPDTGAIRGVPQTITQSLVDWTFAPSWSPDGSTLVYANAPSGLRGELPVLTFRSIETNQERSILPAPGLSGNAPGSAWSFDSQHLYVERYGKDRKLSTYEVNARTGEMQSVAPAWCQLPMPGGQALFCNTHVSDTPGQQDVSTYDLKTGFMTKLKQSEEGLYPDAPSPDGRFILYSGSGGKNFQLVPVGEGMRRMLLEAQPGEHLRPFVWVGLEKIAYLRQRADKVSIWIRDINNGSEVELQGVDLSRIAVTGGLAPLMSFHPNGHEVVWVSNEGKNELWALEHFGRTEHLARRK